VAVRLTLEPEILALLKAIQKRIEVLPGITTEKRNGVDVYLRGAEVFLQLEIKRDYLSLDIWVDDELLEDARASGIARAHPFLGEDAIKVRFERATDLARVARWIEHSHGYAPRRDVRQRERAEERARAAVEAAARAEADAAQRAAEESARRAQEQEQRRISEARQIEARARAAHMYEATVATRVSTPAPAPVKPAKVAPKAKATKATKADAKKTEAKKVPAKKAEAEVKSGRPAKAEPARASSRPAPARTASGVRAKSPAARGTKSATTTRTKSR
jgi:hypothetical protein